MPRADLRGGWQDRPGFCACRQHSSTHAERNGNRGQLTLGSTWLREPCLSSGVTREMELELIRDVVVTAARPVSPAVVWACERTQVAQRHLESGWFQYWSFASECSAGSAESRLKKRKRRRRWSGPMGMFGSLRGSLLDGRTSG